jgi:hypothetical protein
LISKENGGYRMKSVVLYFVSYSFSVVSVLFCMLDSEKSWAVGGISNSKVIVPSTESVEKGRFELEPFFALVFVDDSDDTVQFEAGARFTLGLLDTLEIGANVNYLTIVDSNLVNTDSDFGDTEAGLKYRFIDQGEQFPFSLAYQGGVTFPTSGQDAQWVFEPGGLILTKDFTENFSMDADFVIALVEDESFNIVTDLGLGYFVKSWFQPVIEAAYSFENPDVGDNIHVVNITFGLTSPMTDYLTIILGVTTDVHTENTDEQLALSAAFTFLF